MWGVALFFQTAKADQYNVKCRSYYRGIKTLQVDFVVVEKISASSVSTAATMYLKPGIPHGCSKNLSAAAAGCCTAIAVTVDIN